jgi:hypothetical protein
MAMTQKNGDCESPIGSENQSLPFSISFACGMLGVGTTGNSVFPPALVNKSCLIVNAEVHSYASSVR